MICNLPSQRYSPLSTNEDNSRDESKKRSSPSFLSPRTRRSFAITSLFVILITLVATQFIYGKQSLKHYHVFSSRLRHTASKSITGSDLAIAWLMYYPNTGGFYTNLLVQRISATTVATNYNRDVAIRGLNGNLKLQRENDPVFSDLPDGPFRMSRLDLPGRYILTSTQCTRFRHDTKPEVYVPPLKNINLFRQSCLTGYASSLVQKAILAIRDPFDVIVSRFGDEYQSRLDNKDLDFLAKYSNTPDGFQAFCNDLDYNPDTLAQESKFYDGQIFAASVGVPCHAEFYRYLHWLNMAFQTIRKMGIPRRVVHYVDYRYRLEETIETIFDFLQLKQLHEPPPFRYNGGLLVTHYTREQRDNVKVFIELVASRDTLSELRRYVDLIEPMSSKGGGIGN